jgi:thymidylate kinase
MDHARSNLPIGPQRVGWLAQFLSRREKRYYDAFLLPEVLIVLRVDPAIGSRRSKDGDAAVLRERCREIWDIDWEKIPAHVIDANRPREEVLSDLKSLVWSQL